MVYKSIAQSNRDAARSWFLVRDEMMKKGLVEAAPKCTHSLNIGNV